MNFYRSSATEDGKFCRFTDIIKIKIMEVFEMGTIVN
jgi:hypothetical protein